MKLGPFEVNQVHCCDVLEGLLRLLLLANKSGASMEATMTGCADHNEIDKLIRRSCFLKHLNWNTMMYNRFGKPLAANIASPIIHRKHCLAGALPLSSIRSGCFATFPMHMVSPVWSVVRPPKGRAFVIAKTSLSFEFRSRPLDYASAPFAVSNFGFPPSWFRASTFPVTFSRAESCFVASGPGESPAACWATSGSASAFPPTSFPITGRRTKFRMPLRIRDEKWFPADGAVERKAWLASALPRIDWDERIATTATSALLIGHFPLLRLTKCHHPPCYHIPYLASRITAGPTPKYVEMANRRIGKAVGQRTLEMIWRSNGS